MINIVKNKKTVIFIILVSLLSLQLFAASSYYLGSGLEGKYFTIVTDYQGLSAQEAAWIPDNVKTQLEDYVSRYLGMTNVNNVAKKEAIKHIKESNSLTADESSAMEPQFRSAGYILFVTVRKTPTYNIECRFTEVQTLKNVTYTQNNIKESQDLYSSITIGSITKNLAERMGVQLTSEAKYELEPNGTNLSVAQEIEALKKMQLDAASRVAKQSSSSESDVNKILAEKRQADLNRRLKELQEKEARERQDAIEATKRSGAVNAAIKGFSKKADEAAQNIRTTATGMNIDELLVSIETKKQIYLKTRNSVESEIEALKKNAEAEYERTKKDVTDPKYYSKRYLNENGRVNFSSEGAQKQKYELEAENKSLKTKIDSQLAIDEREIRNSTTSQISTLRSAIEFDKKKFGQKQTFSSMKTSNLMSTGKYNSTLDRWTFDVQIILGDITFISDNITLSFAELKSAFGNELKQYSLDNEDDEWEVYDAALKMKVPFIYVDVDYKIEPMAEKYPSCYTITPLEYRVFNTITRRPIKVLKPNVSFAGLEYLPATDIRTMSEKSADNAADYAAKVKENKTIEKTDVYDQRYGGGARSSIGANFGYAEGINNGFAWNLDWTPGWTSWFYTGLVAGMTPSPIDGKLSFDMLQTFGLNARLPLGNWYPNVYFDWGLGFMIMSTTTLTSTTSTSTLINVPSSSSSSSSTTSKFMMRYAFGIDFPVHNRVAINAQWALVQLTKCAFIDEFTVGVRYGQWQSFSKWTSK